MAIKSFKSLQSDNVFIGRVQDNIKQALSNSSRDVLGDSRVITSLRSTGAGNVTINHGLGITPSFWAVMLKASATYPYEVSKNSRNLVLGFAGAVSFDLLVG